jgi:phage recombination protein Bet
MSINQSLALVSALPTRPQLEKTEIELVKTSIMRGATDSELSYFINLCNGLGLNPFKKEIYAIARKQEVNGKWVEKWESQIAIDGLRALAQRSEQYDGQDEPEWCGADGNWLPVWCLTTPPVAARVKVYKKGIGRPFVGLALYSEFVQTTKDGRPTKFWLKMPANQLAKCAEAQAHRKAAFTTEANHLPVYVDPIVDEYVESEMFSEVNNAPLKKLKSTAPDEIEEARLRAKAKAEQTVEAEPQRITKETAQLISARVAKLKELNVLDAQIRTEFSQSCGDEVKSCKDLTEPQALKYLADLTEWVNQIESTIPSN